jgi:hypothetical protein
MHPAPVKASAWVRERFPHEVPKRGVPAPAVLGVWVEQFHFSGGSADGGRGRSWGGSPTWDCY